jgi:ATP-dependent Clp protease ATP-binding subunit ClpC
MNYSTATKEIIALAQREAQGMAHPSIRSGHLLLGLLGFQSGFASAWLMKSGMSLDAGRTRMKLLGSAALQEETSVFDGLRLDASAMRVLERAGEEAFRLRHSQIEPEHLLLGLLSRANHSAADLLEAQEIAPARMREEFLAELEGET